MVDYSIFGVGATGHGIIFVVRANFHFGDFFLYGYHKRHKK